MSNVFVISDTHFDHKNIIGMCKRPFASVEEMNEAIIDRWNKTVTKHDTVYHLGDVAFSKPGIELCGRLNGNKNLILGNHDTYKHELYAKHFKKIWASVEWKNKCILTHIPISYEEMPRFKINVHGHLHYRGNPGFPHRDHYRCVSIECTNFKPIPLEDVLKWTNSFERNGYHEIEPQYLCRESRGE